MRFCIEKKNSVQMSDRVAEVMSDFDIKPEHSDELCQEDRAYWTEWG